MHTILVVAIGFLTCGPVSGWTQPVTPQLDAQSEERRVLAAEDEYITAEVNRDEAALRRLVDDRFVLNSSNGTTSDKDALIRAVLKMSMVGQTTRERSVLLEGDVAVIFGTADMRFAAPGKPETVSSQRYTSTYVRRAGQWRMVALHMQPRAPQ
jgi:ketosteroid isomerase-like protein